jgi:hypothetical protein
MTVICGAFITAAVILEINGLPSADQTMLAVFFGILAFASRRFS